MAEALAVCRAAPEKADEYSDEFPRFLLERSDDRRIEIPIELEQLHPVERFVSFAKTIPDFERYSATERPRCASR